MPTQCAGYDPPNPASVRHHIQVVDDWGGSVT